jgi:hypothetical protein
MIASRKSLLTAVVAAAALAAGCNGDDGGALSDDEYADKIRPYLTDFGDESQRLAEELQATATNEEAAPLVEDLETLTQTTVDDLEGVEPPEDASDGHQALIDALDGYLAAVSQLLGVIESGSDAEIQEAGAEFVNQAQETLQGLEDARGQLEDAGVPVGEEIDTEIPAG